MANKVSALDRSKKPTNHFSDHHVPCFAILDPDMNDLVHCFVGHLSAHLFNFQFDALNSDELGICMD